MGMLLVANEVQLSIVYFGILEHVRELINNIGVMPQHVFELPDNPSSERLLPVRQLELEERARIRVLLLYSVPSNERCVPCRTRARLLNQPDDVCLATLVSWQQSPSRLATSSPVVLLSLLLRRIAAWLHASKLRPFGPPFRWSDSGHLEDSSL